MGQEYSHTTVSEAIYKLVAESCWFSPEWYAERYPDVSLSGLDPLTHYLRVGEPLGRQAGPYFDAGYYRECYQDVAQANISPLVHYIQNGEREGRAGIRLLARVQETQLWERENVESCLAELAVLLDSQNPLEASYAGWALARWYAWQGEWHRCTKAIAVCMAHPSLPPNAPATRLLYMEALSRCGQYVDAYIQWQTLQVRHPDYLDAHLAMANLLSAQGGALEKANLQAWRLQDTFRLESINTLYQQAGVAPLVCHQPSQPLTLEALTPSVITPRSAAQTITVSVIIPTYNAEAYLATALHSLTCQTLAAIEILVVDDASTDNSLSIAQHFAAKDKRVRVIPQPKNQGAYAARNRGLKEAKGCFITVHDSDDWSHPEKLARQVAALEANPAWVACLSDMVRCTTALYFGRWRIAEADGWIYRNTSSLMVRRDVVEALGYWDRVRCSADTEYLHRIWAAYGQQACGKVLPGVPLSLCRDEPTSLSQAGPTHLVTQFKGVRYDYMTAAHEWHATASRAEDLYLPDYPKKRPFLSPALNLPR
ncbi:glycosyltransferase family 2 protein [Vreelandella populi]|uniref:glycosyltransferase family 2 protein n=1 Tax=Vreelandella populi TaxID=2498858 RepID=UPI0021AF9554|nr:glycosyltransferase family 2 protein [Halomonas populi]